MFVGVREAQRDLKAQRGASSHPSLSTALSAPQQCLAYLRVGDWVGVWVSAWACVGAHWGRHAQEGPRPGHYSSGTNGHSSLTCPRALDLAAHPSENLPGWSVWVTSLRPSASVASLPRILYDPSSPHRCTLALSCGVQQGWDPPQNSIDQPLSNPLRGCKCAGVHEKRHRTRPVHREKCRNRTPLLGTWGRRGNLRFPQLYRELRVALLEVFGDGVGDLGLDATSNDVHAPLLVRQLLRHAGLGIDGLVDGLLHLNGIAMA